MTNFKKSIIRWLPCCLIFFAAACRQEKGYTDMKPTRQDTLAKEAYIRRAYYSIFSLQKMIHNGDIITRVGNDFTSQSLKTLNRRDKRYSHCGIASIERDSVFVYHALGGEFNPDQKIKRETFESFSEPYNNNGVGIFHFVSGTLPAENLVDAARHYYLRGLMFDMDFNLASDDRMYCAEFVYKSFLKAYPGKITFALSHIDKFEFIGVDDIFLHPLSEPVKEIMYK